MLTIKHTITDSLHILRLAGILDSKGAKEFSCSVASGGATATMILDLTDVTRITAEGIAPLRALARHRADNGDAPLLVAHGSLSAEANDATEALPLSQHYADLPIGKVIGLFDHIFTSTLAAWHKGCQDEEIHLFNDLLHDAQGLSQLAANGAANVGLDTCAPTLQSPELERDLPNPFWFAAQKVPAFAGEFRAWPMCVCHNRLNLDAIHYTESGTVFLADLTEAKPGSATTDLAHMEPELLIRLTRLSDDRDLCELARFMDKWFSAPTLRDIPRHQYAGNDLMVIKAFEVMRRLRAHAHTLTGRQTTPTPTDMKLYLAAVLERALQLAAAPELPPERTRAATLLAAVACERILV